MAFLSALMSAFLLIFTTHLKALTIADTVGDDFTSQPKRLITKLIHRDSILSPFYKPNDTVADRIKETMRISTARVAYLYAKTARVSVIDDFRLGLLPSSFEPFLFVNFSMGQPPTPQLAIMDTGSSLLWVQCAPCRGCSQEVGPMLDPLKSSTYANLSCRNPICGHAPQGDCDGWYHCLYNQTYVDAPSSVGILAMERVIFEDPDEGINVLNNMVFGCSHANGNYKDKRFTGIFGLGNGIISIVTQMGSKFSYCLGNIFDPQYSFNRLTLGNGAIIDGDSTPLQLTLGLYIVILEGISVGDKLLVISPSTPSRRRAIIDSGTAPTFLAEKEYKALHDEVKNILDGFLTPYPQKTYLCYVGTVSKDLIGFPVVTLHFTGGADLVLDINSMFYQISENIFCMAVRPGTEHFKDISLIGLMAQQYYNIAYDLADLKLYLQRIDCELLED